jgi:hypothetical protein
MLLRCSAAAAAVVFAAGWAWSGPFAPPAGQPGSTAIPFDSPLFTGWATSGSIVRGPQDINDPAGPLASFGSLADALGPASDSSFAVVSLGDGGSLTLTFDANIRNGPGADFAVFENGFGDTFLELAFVEVSSNGTDFFRFPSVSLTQTATQVDGFGALDATDLHNLAGKYRLGFGTPFDLADLLGVSPLLNVDNVSHVRLIDVVGRITPAPGNPGWLPSRDSLGNLVNDPYATPFSCGGFDADGVGVIHAVPEPASAVGTVLLAAAGALRRRRQAAR